MRIAFYANHPYYGGLNNNGGSRTILLAAQYLKKMGHVVDVVASVDRFTWFKHSPVKKRIHPDTKRVIAVSVSDVEGAVKHKPKKAKVFWWCRLLESYQMPKKKIVKRAGMVEVLANSEWLKTWFKNHGVNARVVYQGVDVNAWYDEGLRSGGKPIIGFLLSKKPRKKFYHIKEIVKGLGDQYDYVGYGAKGDLNAEIKTFIERKLVYFKSNPSHDELLRLYNLANIWLATSDSEGLHNPPLEAALCGCLLVCNGASAGGTADYCIDGETGIVYEKNNPRDAVDRIRTINLRLARALVKTSQVLIQDKIGSRETAMQRMMEVIK